MEKLNLKNIERWCEGDGCVVDWKGRYEILCKNCLEVKGEEDIEEINCKVFGKIKGKKLEKFYKLMEKMDSEKFKGEKY